MITLLSPAKKLNFDPAITQLDMTQPSHLKHTKNLAQTAKKQSADDLKRLMHISDALAELNVERFKNFNLEGQSNWQKQAMLAFDGDVYWGLEAKTMSDADLAYAQNHVRILSGLYGLLRPLDGIQPYRLEMGTKMPNSRGNSLYEFWRPSLAKALLTELKDHADGNLVNLASNEYFKAIDTKSLQPNIAKTAIITAKFLDIKDGKARALMFYAKRARGLMARWIVQNRVDRADGLKDFNLENYKIDSSASTDTELIFSRPQPAVKK